MLKKKSAEELAITDTIVKANAHLTNLSPDSDEYTKTVSNIKELTGVLTELRPKKNNDVWIQVFGHITGIAAIPFVEKAFDYVFTSSAMKLISPFHKK